MTYCQQTKGHFSSFLAVSGAVYINCLGLTRDKQASGEKRLPMRRELVTLQIGTSANYTGAHFWNLQDEYLAIPPSQRELSPSTFFNEVLSGSRAARSGLRYAPRLQVIDANGAFGALSTDAGVVLPTREDGSKFSPAWSKKVRRYVREAIPKSQYVKNILEQESAEGEASAGKQVKLEGDVRYWSDYLKSQYHPRTCFPLQGVHHGVSKLDSFEVGVEVAKTLLLDDAYEQLRYFVEGCDSFGGLCVISNADDAYAGFTSTYLSHLRDELGASSPVLVFGTHSVRRRYGQRGGGSVTDELDIAADTLCMQNEAKLVSSCFEFSTEYIALSPQAVRRFPLLHASSQDLFQSSSVLATAMHVALTPMQMNLSLAGLISAVRPAPFASFGSVACNFPSVALKFEYSSYLYNTPGSVSLSDVYADHTETKPHRTGNAHTLNLRPISVTEVVSARGLGHSLPIFANIATPITIPIPFPTIFHSSMERNLGVSRRSLSSGKNSEATEVEQIAAIAGLATVGAKAHSALNLLGEAVKPSPKKTAAQVIGVEDDELHETGEALIGRAADYLTI